MCVIDGYLWDWELWKRQVFGQKSKGWYRSRRLEEWCWQHGRILYACDPHRTWRALDLETWHVPSFHNESRYTASCSEMSEVQLTCRMFTLRASWAWNCVAWYVSTDVTTQIKIIPGHLAADFEDSHETALTLLPISWPRMESGAY